MLVLSRKIGESILIGEGENQIEVVVYEIRKSIVVVGINAPKSIKILRKEIAGKENEV